MIVTRIPGLKGDREPQRPQSPPRGRAQCTWPHMGDRRMGICAAGITTGTPRQEEETRPGEHEGNPKQTRGLTSTRARARGHGHAHALADGRVAWPRVRYLASSVLLPLEGIRRVNWLIVRRLQPLARPFCYN